MRYLHKHRKILFERETDALTVRMGLGWQLYDWAQYTMNEDSKVSDEYRLFKRHYYLSPEEIEQLILHYSRYADCLPANSACSCPIEPSTRL